MDDLIKRRVERLNALLKDGVNPFEEVRFERSTTSTSLLSQFEKLSPGEETNKSSKIAGRIMSIRVHGGVAFVDLSDYSGKIQLMFRKDTNKKTFDFLEKYLDEGDLIGVDGTILKTKRGQLSLLISEAKLLSKALRPLPSEWYGLKNVETRYRQRYLDLNMNTSVRKGFATVTRLVNGMRNYLVSEEFLEVNTPILQPIYGGAFAKPFKTHHNYLKQDMFLRIAPELYLKKLIVGGFERVFEVASCFRNESVDSTHNPEFIQIEAYQAYVNYEDMMVLIENMISSAVKEATGKMKLTYQGTEIDFTPPWKRVKIGDALKSAGIDVDKLSDKDLIKKAKDKGLSVHRVGDAIEELFGDMVQSTTIQPTFITHFPADISPLAKKFPDNPKLAQRFEVYIAGSEIGNAYSELNNPIEQFLRFKEDETFRKKSKDVEYMPMDRDYVRALEYGMPPTGGLGIGIGRLASIILDKPSIKEVILFPAVAGTEKIETVSEMFPKLADKFS
ncbi:MAG: lysine--tRNA ligase [Candidatus Altiarchaeota archaeon]|nr:lysine--tRNA ligase [Candidatus Altiarchaeota archaeon]